MLLNRASFLRAEAVVGELLDLEPERRHERLSVLCAGDSALRRAVEDLLRAHDQMGESFWAREDDSFLRSPLVREEADPSCGIEDLALPEIGNYRLLTRLGRGGMAVVYLAEQRQPVVRRVAIKLLRSGIETPDSLARFHLEQQALASMDHPNVAKVFDSGTTTGGRPYFVMDYVPGLPITEFCWRRKLDTEARLDLFLQVCSGIEHAHQMGIIHRDLKPSNILVCEKDGMLKVRVIDFGIAKTLHRLIDETLFTRHDQLIGTPEYMSPEQLRFDETVVDTRTDVYSLGVLLYETLVGVSPFGQVATGPDKLGPVREAILHSEPPRASAAAPRVTDERIVPVPDRTLKGDIDWILMKALEKDRRRRYGTVQELAGDVRRHLRDEPVNAGPPGPVYRAVKFSRRHRPHLVAALISFLVVLISAAAFFWAWHRGNRVVMDAAFFSSPLGQILWDEDGDCVEANEAAATYVGATREYIEAQNWRTIASWKTTLGPQPTLYTMAVEAVTSNEIRQGHVLFVSTVGVVIDCHMKCIPLRVAGKQYLLLQFWSSSDAQLETIHKSDKLIETSVVPSSRLPVRPRVKAAETSPSHERGLRGT